MKVAPVNLYRSSQQVILSTDVVKTIWDVNSGHTIPSCRQQDGTT